jgi:3-phosphoshikimate 1-carboxyvinyltransferase
MLIRGGTLGGGRIDSHGDHRIAMAFTVAALKATGDLVIDDVANVATSFPGFAAMARHAGIAIEEVR